jgi:hypothetical protein
MSSKSPKSKDSPKANRQPPSTLATAGVGGLRGRMLSTIFLNRVVYSPWSLLILISIRIRYFLTLTISIAMYVQVLRLKALYIVNEI